MENMQNKFEEWKEAKIISTPKFYLKSLVLDKLLNAINDEYVTIIIYVSDISGMKPPALIDGSLSFFPILVVTYI